MPDKKYKLYFNTTDRNKILVRLYKNQKLVREKSAGPKYASQMLLPLIEDILSEERITLNDLREIEFKRGPGSFTGLKVAASCANMLGNLLNIPVNGQKGKIVEPAYQ